MKSINTLSKVLGAAGISGALATAAVAGSSYDGGASPIVPPPIVHSPSDDLGFSLSAGYDSDYIFRGADLGDNLVWTALDYANDFGSPIEWNIGAWYASTNGNDDTDFNELDIYTGLGTSFGAIDASVGFIAYFFPDTDADETYELYNTLGTEFFGLSTELYTSYDFEIEGWYIALSSGYSIEFSDSISLDVSAGVAYSIDYYFDGSDFNNIDLRIALPIALTDNATLEPYIAGSIALGDLEDVAGEDDYFYGGVSIGVDF